ncbi:hypothetical protein CAQU_04040 [Corynebacterium aquilae DSM 44791]|uniref:Permease n=1 Tax=Corynebacterium aquilae DSM 44791 TaxID=1431546 RepID=A0A1L7CEX0_9CORY|nr:hypothetical protein CAQU_04040 [Corynebacterium aquilae DSM 44791]
MPPGAGRAARFPRRILVAIAIAVVGCVIAWWSQLGTGPGSAADPLVDLSGKAQSWAILTVAITLQALPFLVLGVLVSAAIATVAPVELIRRITPRSSFLTVPLTTTAAIALPGCECSSVPVARSLMSRGISPAAALSFMLAAPSLNPVVIVSTAVAFYDLPAMAWARFGASFVAVLLAGWLWLAVGDNSGLKKRIAGVSDENEAGCNCAHPVAEAGSSRRVAFVHAALADLTQAGGFLVIGAMIAAMVKVFVPITWFVTVGKEPLMAIALMAVLAILLALCSEADAFVAASFTAVSPTAQLVFLVVGPVIDIKLISMQSGTFGAAFTRRFVAVVAVCAIVSAMFVGFVVFGRL